MNKPYQASFIKKGLALYGIFMVMYGVYRFFPVFPLSIICAVNESVYQHCKATFFACLILAGIEYGLFRRRIFQRESYLYSRLSAAIFAPWIVISIWYLAPALYGQLPMLWEIIWANIATLAVCFSIVILERGFEQIRYFRALKIVLWALLSISISLFMIFTFGKLPWADVFIEPDWR